MVEFRQELPKSMVGTVLGKELRAEESRTIWRLTNSHSARIVSLMNLKPCFELELGYAAFDNLIIRWASGAFYG
jgi:hypothetical protein